MSTWSLRQASNTLRKHGQCIGISRVLSAEVEAITNVFGQGTSNCSPKSSVSRKWISQKQVYFSSVADEFFVGTRSLYSHASSTVGDNDGTESRFAELGAPARAEIDEESDADERDREEPLWDLNDTEKRESVEMSEKNALQNLLDAIVKAPGDISEVFNKWVQVGNNLGQITTTLTIVIPLRKRRMYLKALQQYAKQGDVHNTEKLLNKVRQYGYGGRIKSFVILIQAYINSKTPAYGIRERLMAENLVPNKALSAQIVLVDAFRKNAESESNSS